MWEGRYRATVVDTNQYFLTCARYIDLNPVRAQVVERAKDYPWSSCGHYVSGYTDPMVTEHAVYQALGTSDVERREAYAKLVQAGMDQLHASTIRLRTNKGWALGDEEFGRRVEQLSGQSMGSDP